MGYPSGQMTKTWCMLALFLTACGGGGGGGGGGPTPGPVGTSVRLTAAPVEIPVGATERELVVAIGEQAQLGAALLQVDVELPPQLSLPPKQRLRQIVPVATLDGDFVGQSFRVLCGDAANVNPQLLQATELFALRLQPSAPRQPGTYTVRLTSVRAASADGARVESDPNPVEVTVVVR